MEIVLGTVFLLLLFDMSTDEVRLRVIRPISSKMKR